MARLIKADGSRSKPMIRMVWVDESAPSSTPLIGQAGVLLEDVITKERLDRESGYAGRDG
jgi:hypothetical protein